MMSRVTTERFPQLPSTTTALEEEIQQRWEEEDTFARSLEQTEGGEPFVFYEGPPTANGRPGLHHILARTIKDTVARFRTMQGRHVTRIAGWDTHGLPVEIEAERRLGISGKREIEELGIARFNEVCRESVMTYTEEWERFSARIGYWLDYSNPYVTYRPEYIETVWWLLKQIWDRDLIYRGHKILPYCPRCGTGLSSHEVAQGYREIRDPSLYFTVPVLDRDGAPDGREFLVWTTTPWTVVSNVALAVHPDLEYAEVRAGDRRYLLAKERVEAVFPDGDAETVRTVPGRELVGLRYRRPFDWVEAEGEEALNAWQVIPEEFVSAEDGTGIVHLSPAFGADDYEAGRRHGLPVLRPVDDRGRFLESLPIVGGQFVKDADDALVEDLKARGHLFRATREAHSYPHCWRCRSPLLYMARDSWFIRTTAVRDDLLASNAQVRWHPPEIGEGRFGEWLKNNVDWAISRSRYWGTPLPVWVCDGNAECTEAIGSFEELRERAGDLPEAFDPHRPFIDEVTWPCRQGGCTGTMRRTPEVIDVWFDSGSMPYAQWHYPFENREAFERHFPADFICEGVDQTRGWFYSLIAISTLLGRGPAYRNVIVNDLILDAEGQKMSKSRGNVVDPWEALRDHGADAIRWYLLGSSNPWLPKRFDPDGVREGERKVFDTLRNSYRFFALYANLEGWTPEMEAPAASERQVLDRWLLSRLDRLAGLVAERVEGYDLTHAVRAIGDFVTDDLSNWYVRRSRGRFWGSADAADTRAAFATLHEALVTTARLMAPFAPFFADWLHRALTDGESVHLAGLPGTGTPRLDDALERGMEHVRVLATLGRAARESAGVRVRQPLDRLYAVVPGDRPAGDLLEILRDELNVRRVEFIDQAEELVSFVAKPNFRALGSRFARQTPKVAEAIRALPSEALARFRAGESVEVEVDGASHPLEPGDLEIEQTVSGDLVVESQGAYTAVLDPMITPELKREGLAREIVNRVQRLRKDAGLAVADRIALAVGGEDVVVEAARAHEDFIRRETLTVALSVQGAREGHAAERDIDLDGAAGWIALSVQNEGENGAD
jgi:isoleucyl-tRNA synthetase